MIALIFSAILALGQSHHLIFSSSEIVSSGKRFRINLAFIIPGISYFLPLQSPLFKKEAKKLLEQGAPPIEAALQTGFSDQSHFTNYFNRFIGLAPGVYREIFLDKGNAEE